MTIVPKNETLGDKRRKYFRLNSRNVHSQDSNSVVPKSSNGVVRKTTANSSSMFSKSSTLSPEAFNLISPKI